MQAKSIFNKAVTSNFFKPIKKNFSPEPIRLSKEIYSWIKILNIKVKLKVKE